MSVGITHIRAELLLGQRAAKVLPQKEPTGNTIQGLVVQGDGW